MVGVSRKMTERQLSSIEKLLNKVMQFEILLDADSLLTFGASLVRKFFPHCSSRFEPRFIGEFIGSLADWLIRSFYVLPFGYTCRKHYSATCRAD